MLKNKSRILDFHQPLLNLVITIIGLLNMTRLHHNLCRCAVDIFLESCKAPLVDYQPKSQQMSACSFLPPRNWLFSKMVEALIKHATSMSGYPAIGRFCSSNSRNYTAPILPSLCQFRRHPCTTNHSAQGDNSQAHSRSRKKLLTCPRHISGECLCGLLEIWFL